MASLDDPGCCTRRVQACFCVLRNCTWLDGMGSQRTITVMMMQRKRTVVEEKDVG